MMRHEQTWNIYVGQSYQNESIYFPAHATVEMRCIIMCFFFLPSKIIQVSNVIYLLIPKRKSLALWRLNRITTDLAYLVARWLFLSLIALLSPTISDPSPTGGVETNFSNRKLKNEEDEKLPSSISTCKSTHIINMHEWIDETNVHFPFLFLFLYVMSVRLQSARRQDGDGRHLAHGGHGAILRRTAGSHETTVDRLRSPRMLRSI